MDDKEFEITDDTKKEEKIKWIANYYKKKILFNHHSIFQSMC